MCLYVDISGFASTWKQQSTAYKIICFVLLAQTSMIEYGEEL